MIRIRQVRLIDDQGVQVGVVDTEEARRLAIDRGLDLVEVSPDARPPVCKIMDYGKFKYSLKKKEHESKRRQHKVQLKEIRLRPKIGDHDVGYKAARARQFLLDGDKVQVTMLFRGREMSHMDVAKEVLDGFVAKLTDISKVERSAKMEGRRLSLLLNSTAPPRPEKKPAEPKKTEDRKAETKRSPDEKRSADPGAVDRAPPVAPIDTKEASDGAVRDDAPSRGESAPTSDASRISRTNGP
jgi:translation initiation factor IF-3